MKRYLIAILLLGISCATFAAPDAANYANIKNKPTTVSGLALIDAENTLKDSRFGYNCLYNDTVGYNVGMGPYCLTDISTGSGNVGMGMYTLQKNVGDCDTAAGYSALSFLVNASYTTALGFQAGKFIYPASSNTDSEESTYLGANTKSGAAGSKNETVIGYSAVGYGSNTVNIGNDYVTKTVLKTGVCIATIYVQSGYDLTVASGGYFGGDVSADSFTDRTEAPNNLQEAYEIVESMETINGKVDHSKLSSLAWGKKDFKRKTGRKISKKIMVEEPLQLKLKMSPEKHIPMVEKVIEEDEIETISEPDQNGRNISMVVSAQGMVIKDLIKQVSELRGKIK